MSFLYFSIACGKRHRHTHSYFPCTIPYRIFLYFSCLFTKILSQMKHQCIPLCLDSPTPYKITHIPPLRSLLMVMVSKNILMIGQFNFNQGWRCLIVISKRKAYSCPLILYSFQKLRWSCLASNVDFNFFHARPMKEKIACTLLTLSLSLSYRISTSLLYNTAGKKLESRIE